jgi:hypothetical protein
VNAGNSYDPQPQLGIKAQTSRSSGEIVTAEESKMSSRPAAISIAERILASVKNLPRTQRAMWSRGRFNRRSSGSSSRAEIEKRLRFALQLS